MAFDRLAPVALLKLACIVHECYGSYDLAALALSAYDAQTGARLHPTYVDRLTRPGARRARIPRDVRSPLRFSLARDMTGRRFPGAVPS